MLGTFNYIISLGVPNKFCNMKPEQKWFWELSQEAEDRVWSNEVSSWKKKKKKSDYQIVIHFHFQLSSVLYSVKLVISYHQ